MNPLEQFQVNSPTVVHEIFDDEVVVIHLESGSYYTLNKSGAQIWVLLDQGASITTMITTLVGENGGDMPAMTEIVKQFLHKLQQEQLIVPSVAPDNRVATATAPVRLGIRNQPPQFHPPSLRKYTDMQDLLLLDPIHDVEETGWPNAKRG